MTDFKCKYCGKEISENVKVVQVVTGEIKDNDGILLFEEDDDSDVQHFHQTCYLSLTNDPELIDIL